MICVPLRVRAVEDFPRVWCVSLGRNSVPVEEERTSITPRRGSGSTHTSTEEDGVYGGGDDGSRD